MALLKFRVFHISLTNEVPGPPSTPKTGHMLITAGINGMIIIIIIIVIPKKIIIHYMCVIKHSMTSRTIIYNYLKYYVIFT